MITLRQGLKFANDNGYLIAAYKNRVLHTYDIRCYSCYDSILDVKVYKDNNFNHGKIVIVGTKFDFILHNNYNLPQELE